MPDSWDFNKNESNQRAAEALPTVTYSLIFLCVVFTAASMFGEYSAWIPWRRLYEITQMATTDNIWAGRYWVYAVCLFVHLNYVHILFNMIWLYKLGGLLERALKPGYYLGFIVPAGLASIGLEILWSNGNDVGVGFSGVVYAMFGLVWMGRNKNPEWAQIANRSTMAIMVVWAFGCWIATEFYKVGIANGGHFGGFAFGLCAGWWIYGDRIRSLAAAATLSVVALSIVGTTWMPWSVKWLYFKGTQSIARRNMRAAAVYYLGAISKHYQPVDPSGPWYFVYGGYEFDHGNYLAAIDDYQRCAALGFNPPLAWANVARSWHNQYAIDYQKRNYAQANIDRQNETDAILVSNTSK